MPKIPSLSSVFKINEAGFWSRVTGKGKGVSKENIPVDPEQVKDIKGDEDVKKFFGKKEAYDVVQLENDLKEGFRKAGFPAVSRIVHPLQNMKEDDRKELWKVVKQWGADDVAKLVGFAYRWRYGTETEAVYSEAAIPQDDLAYEVFGSSPKPLFRFFAVPDIKEYKGIKKKSKEKEKPKKTPQEIVYVKSLGVNYAELPNNTTVNFEPKFAKPISLYKTKEEAIHALSQADFDKDFTPIGVLVQLVAGNDSPILVPTNNAPSWFGYLYLNILKANGKGMSDISSEDEEYVLLLDSAQFLLLKKYDISSGEPQEYRNADETELFKQLSSKQEDEAEITQQQEEEPTKRSDEPLTQADYDEIDKALSKFEDPEKSSKLKQHALDKAWLDYLAGKKKKLGL